MQAIYDKLLRTRTEELMANPSGRTDALNEATAKVVKHPDFVSPITL